MGVMSVLSVQEMADDFGSNMKILKFETKQILNLNNIGKLIRRLGIELRLSR